MILFIRVNKQGADCETDEDQRTYRQEMTAMSSLKKRVKLPKRVTILTEIFLAIRAPQMTASPVQMMCPRTPPRQTPATSLMPAITMVANWDLENERSLVRVPLVYNERIHIVYVM